jgi:hypothetical protein
LLASRSKLGGWSPVQSSVLFSDVCLHFLKYAQLIFFCIFRGIQEEVGQAVAKEVNGEKRIILNGWLKRLKKQNM